MFVLLLEITIFVFIKFDPLAGMETSRMFIRQILLINKRPTKPIDWDGQNAARLKLDPKSSDAAFSAVLVPNFDKCRAEVTGDVILGAAAE